MITEGALSVYGPASAARSVGEYLRDFLGQAEVGEYVALMAYVERDEENDAVLQSIRHSLSDALRLTVTVGFGPRFLHSTGQLHKGGPNTGLFLQITQDEAEDLPIPKHSYSFGVLKQAQALGDLAALRQAGRRVVRVNIGCDVLPGLHILASTVRGAMGNG